MDKEMAIELLKKLGYEIKESDEISITKDVCTNSESYGKHIVTVNSKDYNFLNDMLEGKQEEGEYLYTVIL